MGQLLNHVCGEAKKDGARRVYCSTNEEGLYEKYGFTFMEMTRNKHGKDSRIYRRDIG